MKFDELIKRLLEDYNYDFTSGKYATGTAYAGGPNTPLNVTMPFQGMGGANQPISGKLFPQGKSKKIKNKKKKKLKFENYSFLKEDPDYIDIDTDDLVVHVDYDEGEAYGFGFVNTDITFSNHKPLEGLKDQQGRLIIGRGETHGQLKNKWLDSLDQGVFITETRESEIKKFDLSDPSQKFELKKYTKFWTEVNGRIILSPAGRVWKNIKNQATGKPITLISFWHFRDKQKNTAHDPSSFGGYNLTKYNELEITPEHVVKILEFLKIPKSSWFDVYVEFMEDEVEGSRHPRSTAMDFINSASKKIKETKPEPEIESEEKKERMEKVQAKMKKGAHGNELNPNFGSPYQSNKAQQAGIPSYAEYHAKRNPYGESVNSYKK